MQTLTPFPPHWFAVYRIGASVVFQLTPCNVAVPTASWRLFPDGLRTTDLAYLVESLAKEPENIQLVLCYVDSIDSAVYLMESARTTLALMKYGMAELFKPAPPLRVADLGRPPAEAPPGDPDTFTMEELKAELNEKYGKNGRVPNGEHYKNAMTDGHDADGAS